MRLAVIPARGGSKRIPRKNIKTFCGKPMIVRSIEAALASARFDRIIVSTDDEIAAFARDCDCDIACSVTSFAFPIQRVIRITEDRQVEMFPPEHFHTRSQDLEVAFHDAGQFYWGKAEAWLTGRPMFSRAAAPVLLPRHRVQNIDTPEDWVRAEWLFRAMQSESIGE